MGWHYCQVHSFVPNDDSRRDAFGWFATSEGVFKQLTGGDAVSIVVLGRLGKEGWEVVGFSSHKLTEGVSFHFVLRKARVDQPGVEDQLEENTKREQMLGFLKRVQKP